MDFCKIKQDNIKLRPYQIEMKQKVFEQWNNGKKSVMMQMPTGTGKTMLFASIIKDLWNDSYDKRNMKRFLVLVHRKELVEQIQETLYKKYGLAHGTIQSGKRDNEMFHIQVAMVQTLAKEKRLNKWKDNEFDFIICDEAHHFLADSYQTIRKAFPEAYLLGVTATPYRLNKQPFTDTFNVLVRSQSISKFIKQGYLSEYEYYSIAPTSKLQLEIDNLKVENTGDYSERAMSNALDKREIRAKVVKTWLEHAKGKKTIVYTINKQHNSHFCQEFNETGYKCVSIDSDTPKEERDNYVNKFRKGEIDIICNVNIFSEGFDCPDVECIQLARPTKSLSMYLQQVGRGLRISKNKEKTIFLDNVGLYNRFGLPSINRQWQRRFEGKEDWDKDIYSNDLDFKEDEFYNEEYKPLQAIIEEADDDFEMQYSNVEYKDELSIVNVAKALNIEVDSIIAFFSNKGVELNPNSILTEEQYIQLKDMLEKQQKKALEDGFVSIFDIPDIEAEKKKNFYCKVKDYKTDKWEIVFYTKFVDCYVDIINNIYVDFLQNKTVEDINLEIYNSNRWQPEHKRWKVLSNLQLINVNLSNRDKLKRLKYVLKKAKEVVYFNFDSNFVFDCTKEIETEKVDKEIIKNKNIIKYKDMEYNIDEMSEKAIIELMLVLHDKINVELIDEKKAEKRLSEINKEQAKKELDIEIESSGYSEEEILKMAARIKEKNEEQNMLENKQLEEIVKRNIESQSSLEEIRRKTALNSLIEKYNSK